MATTILLVPGAWHTKETFAPLADRLEALGHTVHATQLATVGGHGTTIDDTAALGKTLASITDAGSDVVVVAHSYAGFASGPVLKGAAKQDRKAQGKTGGVIGIIYIAAFVAPEGITLINMLGGTLPPWQLVDEQNGIINVHDPANTFYGDVASDVASHSISLMRPQSLKSVHTPAGPQGYTDSAYDGRRAYIHCEDDSALPPIAQTAMVEGSGVPWLVKPMKSSHSPFLSHTDEVADFISGLEKSWKS